MDQIINVYSLNFAWDWLYEGKINLFPALRVWLSLGSFPRKIHIGTCTQEVLPVISGSVGTPVLSLRDLLKVHVPSVRTSLVQGRDNSVPQWESCFILERPLVLRHLFWSVLLELAHCTCLIKLVCLLDSSVGMDPDFPLWYPQVVMSLAYRRMHSQPLVELE